MARMDHLDENVHLCGVDMKIVNHSGRRSQLLLSAKRCGHPSSYIGPSVDRASPAAPRTCNYSLRNARAYGVPRCKTNRFKNSFVPYGLYNWQ